MNRLLMFPILFFAFVSSAVAEKSIVSSMETAHGATTWDERAAISTELELHFGGKSGLKVL